MLAGGAVSPLALILEPSGAGALRGDGRGIQGSPDETNDAEASGKGVAGPCQSGHAPPLHLPHTYTIETKTRRAGHRRETWRAQGSVVAGSDAFPDRRRKTDEFWSDAP
jgi:hypothetical protein